MGTLRDDTKLLEPGHKMLVLLVIVLDGILPLLGLPIGGYLVKNIYLVISSLNVVLRTLLHFECHIAVVSQIFCQPNSRKMTPTEFLNNNISVKQNFSNMDWVVAADLVVRHSFVFTGIFILVKALAKFVPQRIEIIVIHVCIGIMARRMGSSVFGGCLGILNFIHLVHQILDVSGIINSQITIRLKVRVLLLFLLPVLFLLLFFWVLAVLWSIMEIVFGRHELTWLSHIDSLVWTKLIDFILVVIFCWLCVEEVFINLMLTLSSRWCVNIAVQSRGRSLNRCLSLTHLCRQVIFSNAVLLLRSTILSGLLLLLLFLQIDMVVLCQILKLLYIQCIHLF